MAPGTRIGCGVAVDRFGLETDGLTDGWMAND